MSNAGDKFLKRVPWLRLRKAYLAAHTLCQDPFREHYDKSQLVVATEVHHRIPRQHRPDLALEWSNLEAVCKRCHSRLTRQEQLDGYTR